LSVPVYLLGRFVTTKRYARLLFPRKHSSKWASKYSPTRNAYLAFIMLPSSLQVEHDRLLRKVAEDQADLTRRQVELEREREAIRAAAEAQALKDQAEHTMAW
jgi:hypothetical protein